MEAPQDFTRASSRSGLVLALPPTLGLPSPKFMLYSNQNALFIISQTAKVHICAFTHTLRPIQNSLLKLVFPANS